MIRPIVQIYAFTRPEDVLAALASGVDHIGFVAGSYGLVHGELDFAQARRLADIARPTGKAVALTMSTDPQEILRMAQAVMPDYVHISTEPEKVPMAAMQWLRQNLPAEIRLMKAIPVSDETSIELAMIYETCSDCLLLDTQAAGFPGVGATGKTHDWSVSRKIVEQVNIPVILARGLTPENVSAAFHAVHPYGVDLNTATNLPGDPVNKDMPRVAAFARAARSGVE